MHSDQSITVPQSISLVAFTGLCLEFVRNQFFGKIKPWLSIIRSYFRIFHLIKITSKQPRGKNKSERLASKTRFNFYGLPKWSRDMSHIYDFFSQAFLCELRQASWRHYFERNLVPNLGSLYWNKNSKYLLFSQLCRPSLPSQLNKYITSNE